MKDIHYSHWLIAFIVGSIINLSLFMFLPAMGRTEIPAPPQIIELNFLSLPPSDQRKQITPKKVVAKPKIQNKSKLKPKPTKPKITPIPKVKVKPKPVLSESVVPAKLKPKPDLEPDLKPELKTVKEPIETEPQKNVIPTEEVLPIPTSIFKLSNLVSMIHRQIPVYPAEMRAKGKEATVKLVVLIDAKGKVRKITVLKSAGEAFDQAAIDAIQLSTFKPADVKGRPVSAQHKLSVNFRLR